MNVPLALPDITDLEREAVNDVMRTDRLSMGPRLAGFERAACDFVGCRFACGVSSGTAALHIGMIANGISEGAEVITSSFSFIASANCALYVGARPVFADIDAETWNIDPDAVEAVVTGNTKAIVPVHVFGQPCRMDRIMQIAAKHGLAVVEDACEAIGASYDGTAAGTFGDCGTFAFYPNKQITTGEGGMLVTDDEQVDRVARSLRNQGRNEQAKWLTHERLGYNYRLTEMQAALGEVQMKRANEIIQNRSKVMRWYTERLTDVDELVMQAVDPKAKVSPFVFVVRLVDEFSQEQRDRLIELLGEAGIGASAYFAPIHLQEFYRKELGWREGQLPVTERIGARTLAIPFYPTISEDQVDYVCQSLGKLIGRL